MINAIPIDPRTLGNCCEIARDSTTKTMQISKLRKNQIVIAISANQGKSNIYGTYANEENLITSPNRGKDQFNLALLI